MMSPIFPAHRTAYLARGGFMVEQGSKFVELAQNAQEIAVVFEATADTDTVVAATSLFLALQSMGKVVRLYSSDLPSDDPRISGLDQVVTSFGHQNLVVSFDYSEEKVDKISYHIGEDTGKFFLTIKPKKGAEPLDSNSIEYTYSGAEPDLIITVGVSELESLGAVYLGYEDTYANTSVVSIHDYETSFGTLHLLLSDMSSVSEMVGELLRLLGTPITAPLANNLLLGIEDKTRGLHYGTITADTFALVADLLRAGGQRTWTPVKEITPELPKSVPIDREQVVEPSVRKIKSKSRPGRPKKDKKKNKNQKVEQPNEMTVSISRK